MKDLVLIPTWRRDDFLQITLDHIIAANGSDKDKCYIFLVDRNFHQDVVDVIAKFPLCKEVKFAPQHRYFGNSYNVLEGYKYAVENSKNCNSNLIYLIEEDIWIGKDFFDFHEKIQAENDAFCVSACRCQNDPNPKEKEPASIYYHSTFQSLGLSWKPSMLSKVTAHARPEYYRNMKGYIRSLAPKSVYGHSWTEQDGLINRILELSPNKCIYPFIPRAYHAGFVGYNRRGTPLQGTHEERLAALRKMTAAEMNARAEEYKDITPIECEKDYAVERFELKL